MTTKINSDFIIQSEEAKLTDWKNEPSLLILKADLDAAKGFHDTHINKIKKWNDLMYITGSAKPVKIKNRSSIQPKIIRRQAEWRYSALTEPFLGDEDLLNVLPLTFEDTEAARQNALVLNWQFRTKINRVKFIDDYIRAVVDEGTAIVRTGWDREIREEQIEAPVFEFYPVQSEEQLQQLQQAMELKQSNPRMYNEQVDLAIQASVDYLMETGQPVLAQQVGTQITTVETPITNKPTVVVMDPNNVIIDPSCDGDVNLAKFVICSFETCKADLQKTNLYKNLDKVQWDNFNPATDTAHVTKTDAAFQFTDVSRKRVVAYEYWGYYDIEGDGVLQPIVATWIGSTLIRMDINPFPDGKPPFVLVPYLPVKRELYGETDAELLEDNQKVYGATIRGIIDTFGRSANSQLGFAKGMLDPLNKRKFDNGQDYEFNPTVHPANGLIEHKFPEIPNSVLTMLTLQNQEAEALTGVKSFSGGISGEAYGRVATGIRGALDASSKREMAILRRLAQGIIQISTKILQMNQIFLSEEEVVRVTNSQFVTIKREDLAGSFDLKVDISTAEVDDAKSQDLAFMIQTIGPQTDQKISLMLMAEIAELKRMPELAEKLRTFDPSPSPEQQKMMELDMQLKEAELQKIQSEIALNQARAAKEQSVADKTDLDYVEQETGTAHERELEKQKAQSQGNQNLQITKALTSSRKKEDTDPNIEAAIGFNELTRDKDGARPTGAMTRGNIRSMNANLNSSQFDPRQDPALNPNLLI